jgi:hypothetical protein
MVAKAGLAAKAFLSFFLSFLYFSFSFLTCQHRIISVLLVFARTFCPDSAVQYKHTH